MNDFDEQLNRLNEIKKYMRVALKSAQSGDNEGMSNIPREITIMELCDILIDVINEIKKIKDKPELIL